MNLTEPEKIVVKSAVRNSLELRQRYVRLRTEDAKMQRKQKRFREIELPLLKSALAKLRES